MWKGFPAAETYIKRPPFSISGLLSGYPQSSHPSKISRREFLGIYIFAEPKNATERDYNRTMIDKGELIRCRRQEAIINRQFGFIDRHQEDEDFLSYFREMSKKKYQKWEIVYRHFENFVNGKCTFGEVTVDLCKKFGEYLLNAKNLRIEHQPLCRNSVAGYFSTFRGLLKIAYRDKLLKENINDFLEKIEWEDVRKEFLTQEELIKLAETPCKQPSTQAGCTLLLLDRSAHKRHREPYMGKYPECTGHGLVHKDKDTENTNRSGASYKHRGSFVMW